MTYVTDKTKQGELEVFIDNDQSLGYELNTFLKKVFNFFFIPFINNLPVSARKLIKKSNKAVKHVVENATNHAALETLYHKGRTHQRRGLFQEIAHLVWFNTNNSKAVRNRLRLVKRELRKSIEKIYARKKDISILSIASGSARAIVEVLQSLPLDFNGTISVTFLDKNPEALKYSKNLIESNFTSKKFLFNWIEGTAGSFLRSTSADRVDIIEMVGLLDYFDDQKAIDIFNNIHSKLNEGGIFITANIVDNAEQKFLKKVIGWEMIYRYAEDLQQLLIKAGFSQEKVYMFYEPLKIHTIAICNK